MASCFFLTFVWAVILLALVCLCEGEDAAAPRFTLQTKDFEYNLKRYLDFREKARDWLLNSYHGNFSDPSFTLQFFVYDRPPAGLANRLNGVTSYFLLGIMTGRIILIDWKNPCRYSELFDDQNHFDCVSWGKLCTEFRNNQNISKGISNPLSSQDWDPTNDTSTFHNIDTYLSDVKRRLQPNPRYKDAFGTDYELLTAVPILERLLIRPQSSVLNKVKNIIKDADTSLPGLSVHVRVRDPPHRGTSKAQFLSDADLERYLSKVNSTLAKMVEEKGKANLFLAMDNVERKVNWTKHFRGFWGEKLNVFSVPFHEEVHHFGDPACSDVILVDIFLQCCASVGMGTGGSTFSRLIHRICNFSSYSVMIKSKDGDSDSGRVKVWRSGEEEGGAVTKLGGNEVIMVSEPTRKKISIPHKKMKPRKKIKVVKLH